MSIKRVVLVTGASRGIGAQLAVELCDTYPNETLFVLIARDAEKLEETRRALLSKGSATNRYYAVRVDFGDEKLGVDAYKSLVESVLKKEDLTALGELIAVYNHGTLKLQTIEDSASAVSESYQVNLISVWKFLAAVRALFPVKENLKQIHVNLSSKMATLISPSWSLYTTTRIARATLFAILAAEQPSIRVLNYQPGPVYTDMLKDVNDFVSITDAEFAENYKKGSFLTCEQTSKKLVKIITEDTFKSGSTLDYFDYE